jgi:hypothetical protein
VVLGADLLIAPQALSTNAKCSEDVLPLTDPKANPRRVMRHATEAHPALTRTIVAGLADLEAGRELPLAEAKAGFGLK